MDAVERLIADFRSSWAFTRGLTRAFVESTPENRFSFSPHERYGSIARQFRHVLQVTDLYTETIRSGKLSMPAKFARYAGSLHRKDLLAGFDRADRELDELLTNLATTEPTIYDFGGTAMTLGELFDVFIEHEANHHGLWSAYATIGGWPSPESWRDNWDL